MNSGNYSSKKHFVYWLAIRLEAIACGALTLTLGLSNHCRPLELLSGHGHLRDDGGLVRAPVDLAGLSASHGLGTPRRSKDLDMGRSRSVDLKASEVQMASSPGSHVPHAEAQNDSEHFYCHHKCTFREAHGQLQLNL